MGFRADLQRGWEALANNFRTFFKRRLLVLQTFPQF